jgi:asparagine synthetase B (glutamine-hydrolysing)
MIDRNYCLSSYISFRYIWKDGKDFCKGLRHENFVPVAEAERRLVTTAADIYDFIKEQFDQLYSKYENIGILLSGGMDSANLAHFLKPGSHAYTFTSRSGVFNADVERASYYCEKFKLVHHLIEIDFDDYKRYTPIVMAAKGAPVHSIEPQIYKAALMAQNDGVDMVIVGESADLIFGGMDQLISKEWGFDEFAKRYTFLEPEKVLTDPVDMSELYERYRLPEEKIDYMKFMDEVFSIESSSSYMNAFGAAHMPYYDPYARTIMAEPMDMARIRGGEPKYLIRELFAMIYPELPIPFKIPMPRPVDSIFKEWSGPVRPEFRKDIPMETLTGNQKWQLWCAELFLNIFCPIG